MGGTVRRSMAGATRRSGAGGPPGWIALAGLLLAGAATAAFGGLAPAEPSITEVAVEQPYANDLVSVVVHDARVVDTVESQLLEPDAGQRVLVVRMSVTNESTDPLGTGNGAPGSSGASLLAGKTPLLALSGVRAEDPRAWYDGPGRGNPTLQPGVPAEILVAWIIPADALSDGDEVTLQLRSASIRTGKIVLSSRVRYLEPGPVRARFTAPVLDGGSEL